jgi:hypothetical protein
MVRLVRKDRDPRAGTVHRCRTSVSSISPSPCLFDVLTATYVQGAEEWTIRPTSREQRSGALLQGVRATATGLDLRQMVTAAARVDRSA